ncbi:unnamed protein product [Chondrus crispus]|uniref:Uncharacterized protein n=1 Tax=Chondrus crispus TaxID=2769 RepID=R7Q4Y3_CHOCR|nr:unnamed protein product [Chondrus crispus]CDF33074.1 unnamed protein product [Chondrus crispus]|eukprot:XP_005712877.1 unnamed protein product [Chondrus crispus]
MQCQTLTDIAPISRNNLRRLPLDPVISLSNINPYVLHTVVQMRMYLESSEALAEHGCRGAQASETCAGAWEGRSWPCKFYADSVTRETRERRDTHTHK